jgi:cytochrome P450
VGNKLATLELRLVLARLYQRFRVTLVPDQEIRRVHTVTMGLKDGLLINVKPRI